ncbi:uncharacterized protein Triagg1_7127 [Trichoderma aggressivum f. europaeum]|uniref:Mitochondrial outer membrane protein n=1 Tax=Trichoderma aggressivum f. europaeum TaxID=173218 RepID=A0AAE1M173_9HYPO|nr:hypothetical protein Triagg1_7127 [Trichoderma aggressivum f. europaeum]
MAGPPSRPGWFAVPAPVRELFKLFPLTTLPAESLPERAPEPARPRPSLYVFARTLEDARSGRPSFNPQCLKWQTFLRIAGVDVHLVPSNNHASPSGALPFLLPPTTTTTTTTPTTTTSTQDKQSTSNAVTKPTLPLTGSKIHRYAKDNSPRQTTTFPEPPPSRTEAYEALLSQSLRPTWLYALYLHDANTPLLKSLYLPPSPILHLPSLHALRNAATDEILKTTRRPLVDPHQLLLDATDALRSLSALLADDNWFFDQPEPGLFDAQVFAYTYLILDEAFGWADDYSLAQCLAKFDNLVDHRTRLYERCWPEALGEKVNTN